MPKIYVLHENPEWTAPLLERLSALGLPYEDWLLDEGRLDLSVPPPDGVFYNRMSASSHTRGHRYAPEYTAAVLSWLEGHGRRVINSSRALQLEVSKVAQYAALERLGIRTPRTIAVVGKGELIHAARSDSFGNHCYAASARNFSPLMAMAASTVIVETEMLVGQGEIEPEAVHTPGPFVDRVVLLQELTDAYAVVER